MPVVLDDPPAAYHDIANRRASAREQQVVERGIDLGA